MSPKIIESVLLAQRKDKKKETIELEEPCFSKTELQIKGVTKVMEKQINKYKSWLLITNHIYPDTFRNSSVANTVDQFPKANHTHNHRKPNT